MANSLATGVAGLLAHQQLLNVTGNNLANVNTTAYKAQRANFADTFYETLRLASTGPQDNLGGINPSMVGSGVMVSQVDRNFSQSSFELTGRTYDMAIDGDGFFVLNDGTSNVLSRAGTFGLDGKNMLVDQATGYPVQRFGTKGETDGVTPGFQVAGDSSIRIPIGTTVLGVASETIGVEGNLSSTALVPSAAALRTTKPFLTGGNPATSATLLADLDNVSNDYVFGDVLEIVGVDTNGDDVSESFAIDPSLTTVGDIVAAINGAFDDVTATIDEFGGLEVNANQNGPAPLQIRLSDADGNVGSGGFDEHDFGVMNVGSMGSVVSSAVEYFDTSGGRRTIEVRFRKHSTNSWTIEASIDPDEATLDFTSLGEIRFNNDGSFDEIEGRSGTTVPVSIRYPGNDIPQVVQLAVGGSDGFSGLTQTANSSATLVASDGFESGTLVSAAIQQDGTVMGIGSNGRRIPIAQMVVARVVNPNGLDSIGQNHFAVTSNSGQMNLGAGTTGGRGRILSGQLEGSNVDLAYEFTRLIVAQRGFSANARSITVTDQILDEVSNIIR